MCVYTITIYVLIVDTKRMLIIGLADSAAQMGVKKLLPLCVDIFICFEGHYVISREKHNGVFEVCDNVLK